jgi:hypothetical protein
MALQCVHRHRAQCLDDGRRPQGCVDPDFAPP